MQHVVFNIGYIGTGSGILSHYPFLWEDCSPKTFAKKMRQKGNIKQLFKWAKERHVPPSTIVVFACFRDDDTESNFTIKMINVREYRTHWKQIYKKEWK